MELNGAEIIRRSGRPQLDTDLFFDDCKRERQKTEPVKLFVHDARTNRSIPTISLRIAATLFGPTLAQLRPGSPDPWASQTAVTKSSKESCLGRSRGVRTWPWLELSRDRLLAGKQKFIDGFRGTQRAEP
jgi:hypothetical protein